eukprot:SAG22_NODE_9592_length_580_cov_54.486486_1_plen_193_part_11
MPMVLPAATTVARTLMAVSLRFFCCPRAPRARRDRGHRRSARGPPRQRQHPPPPPLLPLPRWTADQRSWVVRVMLTQWVCLRGADSCLACAGCLQRARAWGGTGGAAAGLPGLRVGVGAGVGGILCRGSAPSGAGGGGSIICLLHRKKKLDRIRHHPKPWPRCTNMCAFYCKPWAGPWNIGRGPLNTAVNLAT